MKTYSPYFLIAFLAMLTLPNYAFSADQFLTTGSKVSALIGADDSINITIEKNRSYVCTIFPQAQEGPFGLEPMIVGPGMTSLTGKLIGNVTPQVTIPPGDGLSVDNRISIIPSTSGTHTLGLAAAGSETEDRNYSIECLESTLFAAYNTVVNAFNFLEVENMTNSTVTGTVTAVNFDATFENPTAQFAFSVPATGRKDINIHDRVGANKFGLLIVSHDGPHGSLKGRVAQYVGTVESFTLAETVPLSPREQTN